MESLYIHYYWIPMYIAAIVSLYNIITKKNATIWLCIILVITIATEAFANYLMKLGQYNIWLYNLYQIFEITIYLQILKAFCVNKVAKKVIFILQNLYLIISILNICFFQGLFVYNTVSCALGSLFMLVTCLYYFSEIFLYHKHMRLKNEPSFWITTGLLFFYAVSFPHFVSINFRNHLFPIHFTRVLANLLNVTNVILYTLFCIGLLCNYKKANYTS
jgi:hypothetical protein